MQAIKAKAPSKMKIAKAALFAAFTMVAANSITLEAQAKTEEVVVETSEVKQSSDSGERYIYSTFGEGLDTKYCEAEKDIENITEKVCREGDFKYVTPEILESIAYQESKFVASAENDSAITMYQIKPQFHEEAMHSAGVTMEEIKQDPEAQTIYAAHVIEDYAEMWEDQGLTEEDVIKAAVTNYHLVQDVADEKIKTGRWDDYTNTVLNRAEIISENKEKGLSANAQYAKVDKPGESDYQMEIL